MTPEDEEFNRIEMESRIKQEYVRSMKQEMVPLQAVLEMRDYIRELEWAIKELRERIVELSGSKKTKWAGLTEEKEINKEFDALFAEHQKLLGELQAMRSVKRTWVGLTDIEWSDLYEAHHDKYNLPKQGSLDGMDYERAIEAKLRSKNHA